MPQKSKGAAWLFDYDSLFGSFSPKPKSDEDELAAIYYQLQSDDSRPVGGSPSADASVLTVAPTSENSQSPILADLEEESSSDDEEVICYTPSVQNTPQSVVDPVSPSVDSAGTSSFSLDSAAQNLTNLDSEVIVTPHTISRIHSYHPHENIIGNSEVGVQTRHQVSNALSCFYSKVADIQNRVSFSCFISQVEPATYKEALREESWVNAMQEELFQFSKLGVWHLVDLPVEAKSIGTKWVFKCKRDDRGVIVRNKVRLVVQGFR